MFCRVADVVALVVLLAAAGSAQPDAVPGPLLVQVLDRANRPVAGIPVEIPILSSGESGGVAVTEGAAGIARFPPGDRSLIRHAEEHGVVVVLGTVGAGLVRTVVRSWDEPVRIVLPEAGSVAIEVTLDNGEPVPDAAGLRLFVLNPLPCHFRAFKVRGGTAVVPWVRTGASLWIQLDDLEGFRFSPNRGHALVRGPTVSGERAFTRIAVEATRPLLHGRVVMPDGEPAAAPIQLMFQRVLQSGAADDRNAPRGCCVGSDFLHPCYFALDGAGGFCLALRAESRYRELRVRAVEDGQVLAYASVGLEETYPKGLHDVGTIRLEASHFLVGGVVVDGTGKPVAGAAVGLLRDTGAGHRWWRQDRPEKSVYWPSVVAAPPESRHRDFAVRTGPDGRFEIWGAPGAREVNLAVRSGKRPLRLFEQVPAGTRDLRFQLPE